MQEHKPCVTHLVTQCCPPALLTQVCTSAVGLGLKAAGETALPCSNNEWGLGVCVGGLGVRTGPSNYLHTLTFRSTLQGCSLSAIWATLLIFLSFYYQSQRLHQAWKTYLFMYFFSGMNLNLMRYLPQNLDTAPLSGTSWRPQGPSGPPLPCFHTRKQSQQHLDSAGLNTLLACESFQHETKSLLLHVNHVLWKQGNLPPLPASHYTGLCLPSPRQPPSCRKWSLP